MSPVASDNINGRTAAGAGDGWMSAALCLSLSPLYRPTPRIVVSTASGAGTK